MICHVFSGERHVFRTGVLKMIDTLSSDIEKEMAVAKTEEADAQADYEVTIKARRVGFHRDFMGIS